ncbi:MAG: glycosyltransferase family 4 protein [Nanoarchaeota archaeon]
MPKLFRYDLVHIQHEYNLLGWFGLPYFFLFALLGILKKKSLVVTMHNILSRKEKFQGGRIKTFLRKILYNLQNRLISLSADKIIVHTTYFKKILVKEYGLPSNKIVILPHAIIENIKTISQKKSKRELKLSGPVYLLIGTMMPDHGHDIILRQADKIGKTIVVASNPSAVNYRNESKIRNFLQLNQDIVKRNNFEKFVRFDLGHIPYDKWWKYISAADIVLLPYKGGVGSGIFADAMTLKKPVVANNVPYFRDLAKEYGCLKIAEKENYFPSVIKESMNPKNYGIMKLESARYFNENGLTQVAEKYKRLYLSLV